MQSLSTDMIIFSESADVPTTHSIGRWNLLVSCLIPTAEPFILKGVFHFLFILMLSLFNMEGEKKTHIMPLLSPLSPFEMLASKGGRSDKIIQQFRNKSVGLLQRVWFKKTADTHKISPRNRMMLYAPFLCVCVYFDCESWS